MSDANRPAPINKTCLMIFMFAIQFASRFKPHWMSLNKFIGRVPFLTAQPKTDSLKFTSQEPATRRVLNPNSEAGFGHGSGTGILPVELRLRPHGSFFSAPRGKRPARCRSHYRRQFPFRSSGLEQFFQSNPVSLVAGRGFHASNTRSRRSSIPDLVPSNKNGSANQIHAAVVKPV